MIQIIRHHSWPFKHETPFQIRTFIVFNSISCPSWLVVNATDLCFDKCPGSLPQAIVALLYIHWTTMDVFSNPMIHNHELQELSHHNLTLIWSILSPSSSSLFTITIHCNLSILGYTLLCVPEIIPLLLDTLPRVQQTNTTGDRLGRASTRISPCGREHVVRPETHILSGRRIEVVNGTWLSAHLLPKCIPRSLFIRYRFLLVFYR